MFVRSCSEPDDDCDCCRGAEKDVIAAAPLIWLRSWVSRRRLRGNGWRGGWTRSLPIGEWPSFTDQERKCCSTAISRPAVWN